MADTPHSPSISLMLAVPDAPAAVEWYEHALGARLLWSLGSVGVVAEQPGPAVLIGVLSYLLYQFVFLIFNR